MSLKYTIGDLVWATRRGQCPWPGRVSDPPTDLDLPKDNSDYHCIYFFGLKYYKWVRERHLKPYEEFQEEMMRYCATEGFMDALIQIVDYIENPEKFTQFGHEIHIEDDIKDPKEEVKEEDDDTMELNYDQVITDEKNDCNPMEPAAVEQEVDKNQEISDEKNDCKPMDTSAVEEEVDKNQEVTDEKNDCKPMDTSVVEQKVGTNQENTDEKNYCNPIDTSAVDQDAEKNVLCPMQARVLLPRLTIHECEVCAVCFLKWKDFERHKQKHIQEMEEPRVHKNIEEMEDKTESTETETQKEYENYNNNSNICDKNEIDSRTITFTILDNKIKLKFRNRKLEVPPMLDPVVELDRIDAKKCKLCNQCFLDTDEYRIHEMSHLNSERNKVKDEMNMHDKPYEGNQSESSVVLESTMDMQLVVLDPFKICHCGKGYYDFGEYKEHKKHVHNETVGNEQETSKVDLVQEAKDELEVDVEQIIEPKNEADDKPVLDNICPTRIVPKKVKKIKLGLVPRSKITLQVNDNLVKAKEKNNMINKLKKIFSDKYCKQTFIDRDNAQTEIDAHTEGKFIDKDNAQTEIVAHTEGKRYPCDQCEKCFTQPGSLKIHLKRHAGIKDIACRYCPKTFYYTGNRDIHERIHTGIKPYYCDCCSKAFAYKRSYDVHIRTHIGESRHECDICFKRYTEIKSLKRHKIKVHDKSKAIKCNLCSKTFCFPYEIRKHLKIAHENTKSD